MKIDASVMTADLHSVAEQARRIEALGYDGLFTAETQHDPFFPLLLAAGTTERIELGTGIAVAFPRSPLHLAHIGHDLQAYSRGRLILGLGSQIKAHIEKRFSSTFSHPAPRMREIILATKAIWKTWNEGVPLRFEGEFYRHTLMTPFFSPKPSGYPDPKVFVAAVGEKMTEVVGEAADGMFVHGFTTERYVREVTLPAVDRGLARSGRSRGDVELAGSVFTVTGQTDEEMAKADAAVRTQIAFYGSTPAYRPVLALHGWEDLSDELNGLSKQGQWEEMGRRISDDVLDTFAVRGKASEVPGLIQARFGDVFDRLTLYTPYRTDPESWGELLQGFKSQG
jgi:probable F420-dependent oxidoreductase